MTASSCTSAAAGGSVQHPHPHLRPNSRVNCGLWRGPLWANLPKPSGGAGPLAEIWGRKSRPVRFQTKKVGPPRTCSQPAKARAKMRWLRWCGEAWPRGGVGGGEGRGRKGRERGAEGMEKAPVSGRPAEANLGKVEVPARPSTPSQGSSPSRGESVQGRLSVGAQVMINPLLSQALSPQPNLAVVWGGSAGGTRQVHVGK